MNAADDPGASSRVPRDWSRRGALAALAGTAALGHAGAAAVAAPPGDSAAAIASAKGMFLGSAVSLRPLTQDPVYRALLSANCNLFVHASALMWHEVEKQLGQPYDFTDAEAIYAFGRAAGKPFRGHMMLDWSGLTPGLAQSIDAMSAAQAADLLQKHVSSYADHWRGRFLQWNVVNEPVCGDLCRKHPFQAKLGERYIDLAFAAAAQHDPGVPLSLNQNLIEMQGRYQEKSRDSTLALIQRLHARGVRVGSVGIEGHLQSDTAVDQRGLHEFIGALAGMGISFFISEFDIDDRYLPADPASRDIASAALARDFFDVTLSQPTCLGIIFWGLLDRYNWIVKDPKRARSDGVPQRPSPFDVNGTPKPMWDETIKALRKAPGPGRASLLRA